MASKKKSQSSPAFVTPMAAVAVKQLPEGEEWFYEVKFDGYRAVVIKDGTWVELQSRNHKNPTAMYPTVTSAASKLCANQVVIDGEIVALDETGRPAFQALQQLPESGLRIAGIRLQRCLSVWPISSDRILCACMGAVESSACRRGDDPRTPRSVRNRGCEGHHTDQRALG
jgi:hypothetical protein